MSRLKEPNTAGPSTDRPLLVFHTPHVSDAEVGDPALQYFSRNWWSSTKLVRLSLLVLLHEHPRHGYELGNSLQSIGFDGAVVGKVYRALHWMDGMGLVHPSWDTTSLGPARRVYRLSPVGMTVLDHLAPEVRRNIKNVADEAVRSYLAGRLRLVTRGRRSFEYCVTTTVVVNATHAESAQRKMERTFGKESQLAVDIRTTGTFELQQASPAGQPAAGTEALGSTRAG